MIAPTALIGNAPRFIATTSNNEIPPRRLRWQKGNDMKTYNVVYQDSPYNAGKNLSVCAKNAQDAYDKAVYEILPTMPYAAYVSSYTTKDGKHHIFNLNCFGKPYWKEQNMKDWYEVFTADVEPDHSNIDRIEMNAYEDIAYYKDGTSEVLYHYCDW